MEKPIERHIDFLDPIRGIAILLVFLFHSLTAAFGRDELPWGPWFRDFHVPHSFVALFPVTFGWAGVAIFFVVSGFCIHLSFSRQPNWALFFRRRFFRIYPPYLAVLLFFAFLFPMTRLHFSADETAVGQLLSHAGLYDNFSALWQFGINPSFWSIAVEVQLYLLYPLLILMVSRFGWRRSLVALAVLEITLRLADGVLFTARGAGLPVWVSGSPFIYWFSWSLGAFIAERHIRGESLPVPRSLIYGLAVLAVGTSLIKPLFNLPFVLFALLTTAVVAKLLHHSDRPFPLPNALRNHLRQVGLWSFSLYLLHQPLLWIIPRIIARTMPGAHIHPLLIFFGGVASWVFIVPVARLSYQYCELPSIAFGKRFRGPKAPPQVLVRTDAEGAAHVPPAAGLAEVTPVPPVVKL